MVADTEARPGSEALNAELLTDLKRRQASLENIMLKHGLGAILIVGNSTVAQPAYGCFRYYTGHKVYYHHQAIVARPGKPIAICGGSALYKLPLETRGFSDIRISPDILGSVLAALNEQPIARIGLSLDVLPASWYLELRKLKIECLDITDDIFAYRNERSEFEVRATRKSAEIADAGYRAVCGMVRPGIRMSDLHAQLDYAMKKAGADETFTLMSNGRFSFENNQLPCIAPFTWPDGRVVSHGDNIAMEITPRYLGYWTQMVRTVCVGSSNPDIEAAHKAQLETIGATVPLLKPGMRLGDVLTHMWEFGKKLGYTNKMPFGHILGIDLDEGGRASLESDVILKENMTFVLHPTLVTPNIDYGIFWGETYLVAEGGGERLTSCGDELLTL